MQPRSTELSDAPERRPRAGSRAPAPPTSTGTAAVDWNRLRRLLGLLVVAGCCAAVVGVIVGAAGLVAVDQESTDDWTAFGEALAALALGVLAGLVTFAVAVAVGIRFAVPQGRRLRTALSILAAAAVVPAGSSMLTAAVERTPLAPVGTAAGVALVTLAVAIIGVASGAVPMPSGRRGALIGAAVLGGVLLVGAVMGVLARREEAARFDGTDAPLALVDGTSLEPPSTTWTIEEIDGRGSSDAVSITYLDGHGGAGRFVRLAMDSDPLLHSCERPGAERSCVRLGELPDGTTIWGARAWERTDLEHADAVWVDVAGGRWSIQTTSLNDPIGTDVAVAVLSSLQPVDAQAFARAT